MVSIDEAQQLAQQITEAVDRLNFALGEAAAAGLSVDIDVHPFQEVTRPTASIITASVQLPLLDGRRPHR